MAKAVALLSGGLDSSLAIKLVQMQGVEVVALHFVSVFNAGAKEGRGLAARAAAKNLGCELRCVHFTDEQLEIVKNPPHGYGSAANPCIDCHMAMLLRAAAVMREIGADFIVTGEVAGQRPMSQRLFVLDMIDRQTGLGGIILRPLSAKLLPETEAEKRGLVDRSRLEGIKGRGRTRQMELAREFGIEKYPTPAGGCLLTDPQFGARVKDLILRGELDVNNAHVLKVGRHYRLDERTKAVVGRDERENGVIETYARAGDILMWIEDVPGPTTLLRGDVREENVLAAAALAARGSKAKTLPSARVRVRRAREKDEGRVVEVVPADDETAEKLAVAKKKQKDAE